jgi:periplasmic protein CpxP/Spy
MKKIILSVAVVILGVLSAKTQEIPERKTEDTKPILKEKIIDKKQRDNLNLTDEQRTKLKSMNEDLRKQMEDLRKQDNLTVKEYREKMETLRKTRESQFQSILTPEQQTQMQKDRDARNARTKEFGKRREQKMKEELNLTDQQVAKMSESRKATMKQIETIKADKSLTDNQRRDKIKEAMKSQKESTRRLLTDEQLKKLKESRKGHHKKRKPEVS